jgi:hypothetical protein
MYNNAMTTRPTQAMGWAEMATGLAVAAATFAVIAFLTSSVARGRHVVLEGGASGLLIALSLGVGVFVSGRFRAWGLRRQAVSGTRS